ncbi:MAG: hypothetical protein IT338_11900 [Thermomicrobiales bacterium]|nr:hypothetical protein [Thermomicrobiales bacterium]
MIDPTTASNDRLRDTSRWGYTGVGLDEPMPVEERGGGHRWLLWAALIAIVVIALIALVGPGVTGGV